MPEAVIKTLTSPWGLFLLTLAGAVCGLLVHAAAPDARPGLLGILLRGLLGALAGVWAAALLPLPNLLTLEFRGLGFPIGWALLGGISCMLMLRVLNI